MRDIWAGGVLLMLSGALYIAIPYQVETLEGDSLTPASLPRALAILIAVLSAGLLAQGIRARRQGLPAIDKPPSLPAGLQVLAVISVVALYVGFMDWLGYLLASGLSAGALALLYGHRRGWQIIILMLLAPPALMVFFRYTMLVLLPQGRLFG